MGSRTAELENILKCLIVQTKVLFYWTPCERCDENHSIIEIVVHSSELNGHNLETLCRSLKPNTAIINVGDIIIIDGNSRRKTVKFPVLHRILRVGEPEKPRQ